MTICASPTWGWNLPELRVKDQKDPDDPLGSHPSLQDG
jgi:hypothetical protein